MTLDAIDHATPKYKRLMDSLPVSQRKMHRGAYPLAQSSRSNSYSAGMSAGTSHGKHGTHPVESQKVSYCIPLASGHWPTPALAEWYSCTQAREVALMRIQGKFQ